MEYNGSDGLRLASHCAVASGSSFARACTCLESNEEISKDSEVPLLGCAISRKKSSASVELSSVNASIVDSSSG